LDVPSGSARDRVGLFSWDVGCQAFGRAPALE
jgi:hypothetical protein